jgi:hypothetical protein
MLPPSPRLPLIKRGSITEDRRSGEIGRCRLGVIDCRPESTRELGDETFQHFVSESLNRSRAVVRGNNTHGSLRASGDEQRKKMLQKQESERNTLKMAQQAQLEWLSRQLEFQDPKHELEVIMFYYNIESC